MAFRGVLNFFMVLHPKETHLVMSVIFQGRVQCGPFILFLNTNAHLVMHFQKDNKIKSTFQKKNHVSGDV